MINEKQYNIIIYSLSNAIVGILRDYTEFSFGEKINGFVNCSITMNANKLPNWVLKEFKQGCNVVIQKKIDGVFRNVWGGKMTNKKDWSVDNLNIRTQTATFKHFGQDYLENVLISKNYNIPTDDGLILADIILYGQNPVNYSNQTVPFSVTNEEADYGIVIGSVDLTGNLSVFNFSQKNITLQKGIEQIINSKDPSNLDKQYLISPCFQKQNLKEFYFFKSQNKSIKATFSGVSGTGLTNYTKQNINKLKTTTGEIKTLIIGTGNGINSGVRSGPSSGIVKKFKPKIKEVNFKNVSNLSILLGLLDKELTKWENPQKLIELEIMPNDEQIGKFGVGQYIKIDWINTDDTLENVSGVFRVYEINIKYNNIGFEVATIKIALDDPVSLVSGFESLLTVVRDSKDRLTILEKL